MDFGSVAKTGLGTLVRHIFGKKGQLKTNVSAIVNAFAIIKGDNRTLKHNYALKYRNTFFLNIQNLIIVARLKQLKPNCQWP